MTEVISVISGKGGVGKTTVTSNLAGALTSRGRSVLVIDGNISGANLGIHLGMISPDKDINNVLEGNAMPQEAIAQHRIGFNVMPASLNYAGDRVHGFSSVVSSALGKYDYVLIDTAAGCDDEVSYALKASDSAILVTNPDLPSLSNAALVNRLARNLKTDVKGVVVNNVRGEYLEVSDKDISNFLGTDIIARIPHHSSVPKSLMFGRTVFEHSPGSPVTREIKDLSARITGDQQESTSPLMQAISRIPGIKDRL